MSNSVELQRQYQVLVIEDEPTNIAVITGCLHQTVNISIAKTKSKALQILKERSFDVVLLDILLPDGNGFDICQEVVSNKEVYGVSNIIFMTSLDSPDDEAKGLSLGASDYIHKPINCQVLKARVKLQLQLIRKTELLDRLARIDGLTEIPNRRAFDDQLEKEWQRARREKKCLSLALLDIDYFKQYNDLYGHPAGDQCLKQLAFCLTKSFQRGSDFVARYGGEEFGVLLYGAGLEKSIELLNNSLMYFIEQKIPHQGSQVKKIVSFSTGLCTAYPEKDHFSHFLESTDKMLYQAKEQGRARVRGVLLSDLGINQSPRSE